MNGIFMNSRGLGDLAKHLNIAQYVRDHKLDFLAISETGRRDFPVSVLDRLSGGMDFTWHSIPPRGRSGGILLGVLSDSMEVLAYTSGEFHIKFHIRNKADGFIWSLVAVYGAAQEERKAAFLRELVNLANNDPHPILIGGDFNLLRFPHEKSKGRFDNHWPFLFNAVIDSLDLRQVHMTGRRFTWANSLPEPTYEKLDRVLMSTDWEDKYPLVTVRALERIEDLSDHAPLLLSTGTLKPNARHRFKFELGWLLRDGFDDMVKRVWSAPVPGNSPVRRWNAKIRNLRKYLRGWARHTTGILKKRRSFCAPSLTSLTAWQKHEC